MTISIARGPRGADSPFLIFYGSTSNSSSPTDGVNFVSNITAAVNATNPNGVDITNDLATAGAGTNVYEVFDAPYDEWRDLNDSSFSSAGEVVNYINTLTAERVDSINSRYNFVGTASTIQVTQNVAFEHSVAQDYISGYFWREIDFPNGVEVSRYDRRIISGIITQIGLYDLTYEVANQSGIATNTLTLDVL